MAPHGANAAGRSFTWVDVVNCGRGVGLCCRMRMNRILTRRVITIK
jgi:hypothetical protein